MDRIVTRCPGAIDVTETCKRLAVFGMLSGAGGIDRLESPDGLFRRRAARRRTAHNPLVAQIIFRPFPQAFQPDRVVQSFPSKFYLLFFRKI